MQETYIKQADFKDWLTLPLTKTFIKILTNQKEQYLNRANNITAQEYFKKGLNETATILYGKADGVQTVLQLMEDCKEDTQLTRTINNEEVAIYPVINELFEQTFGEEK